MLRIAVAQTSGSRLGDWPATQALVETLISDAAARNADAVVFPECVWPAYFLGSSAEYFRMREAGMPSERWFLGQVKTWARTRRISVCLGHVAEHEGRLRNAATLISAAGEALATYHKCFLWDFDHDFFEPGDGLRVVETEWGRVGLMICADARLPEIPATLATGGAELIFQPTAWVNVGTPERPWNPQPELLIPDRARELGVPIASASKWGTEGSTAFVGSSLICDGAGRVLVQSGTHGTGIAVADVAPTSSRAPRLSSSQRARLLGGEPPELPRPDVPPLRVALLTDRANAQSAFRVLRDAAGGGPAQPTLFLVPADETTPASVKHTGGQATGGTPDDWLLMAGPGDVQRIGNVRVGRVSDLDADRFAAIRALALGGAHAVVVFGNNVDVRTLRTRAAENRLFVIQVAPGTARAYDPQGQPAGVAAAWEPTGVERHPHTLNLDVARAANKEFAPRTNAFLDRTPALYAF
jgi:predicted amidohydrolase